MTARSEGFRSRRGPLEGFAPDFVDADALQSEWTPRLTGIGVALREAREARELTFANAERDTHIPRHHLQALEEERFGAFHAPVYARGFLRSYSQYLGLNSSDLLALMPPDSPPEQDELQPLSRLGRPRGPREAARARGSPAARDAAPIRSDPSGVVSFDPYEQQPDSDRSGRMRFAVSAPEAPMRRPTTRLDPLGRLGWPERPGEAPGSGTEAAVSARLEPLASDETDAILSPRGPRRSQMRPSGHTAVPSELRPLFSPSSVLAGVGIALGLALLWVVALAVSGGDQSPDILAEASAPEPAASATVHVASRPAGARGAMPDLRGAELGASLATLKSLGVTPIVIQQTLDPAAQQVIAQAPAAGAGLHSDVPVLIVVGKRN